MVSPSPFSDLQSVIRAIKGSLGGWGLRGMLSQALVFLVYRRLATIGRRMERLVARFEAGRLRPVAPRQAGAASGPRDEVAPLEVAPLEMGRPQRLWPRRFGWLVDRAAYQAAGFGLQLQAILTTPEMVALLIAAPQAARILQPMCRMLAVETALLRPGQAVVAVAPAEDVAARPKRVRKAVAVDWGRIPLPRGVLSAARREGFGRSGFPKRA